MAIELKPKLKPIWTRRLDAIAAADPDYPNMAFEEWYGQGLECYRWNLPRVLVRQAFKALVQNKRRHWGQSIEAWHVRAFVYGLRGGCDDRNVCRAPGYVWPLPEDPAWQFVVFQYLSGYAVLDWVHPVSRRFWSQDNPELGLPPHRRGEMEGVDGQRWFLRMGFDLIVELPPSAAVQVDPASAPSHLSSVPNPASSIAAKVHQSPHP